HVTAGGDAAENALLAGQAAGHFDCLVRSGGHDAIDVFQAQYLGNKTVADALDLVRPPASSGDDVALGRLYDEDLDSGILLFQVLRCPGHSSPGALRKNQRADATLCLLPDLRSGGAIVGLDIVDVGKLSDLPVLARRGCL